MLNLCHLHLTTTRSQQFAKSLKTFSLLTIWWLILYFSFFTWTLTLTCDQWHPVPPTSESAADNEEIKNATVFVNCSCDAQPRQLPMDWMKIHWFNHIFTVEMNDLSWFTLNIPFGTNDMDTGKINRICLIMCHDASLCEWVNQLTFNKQRIIVDLSTQQMKRWKIVHIMKLYLQINQSERW